MSKWVCALCNPFCHHEIIGDDMEIPDTCLYSCVNKKPKWEEEEVDE